MSSYNDIKISIESYDNFNKIQPLLDNITNDEKNQVLRFAAKYQRVDIVDYILEQFIEDGVIQKMSESIKFKDMVNELYEKYHFETLNLIRPYISNEMHQNLLFLGFVKTLDSFDPTYFETYMSNYSHFIMEVDPETKIKMLNKISQINDPDGLFFNDYLHNLFDKIKSDYKDYSIENQKKINEIFISSIIQNDQKQRRLLINHLKNFLNLDDFFLDNNFKYIDAVIKKYDLFQTTNKEPSLFLELKKLFFKIRPFIKNINSIDNIIDNKEAFFNTFQEHIKYKKIKEDIQEFFDLFPYFKKQMILENKTKSLSLKKLK